jgi:hypothetical protein
MTFEEDYQDVLQNLEATIIMFWQENPDLIDAEVETALDWLIRLYNAQIQGRSFSRPLRGISRQVAEDVKSMCEIRLGRSQLRDEEGNAILDLGNITLDEIVECLKRIKSSVNFWTKERGRQGYLNFVKQFIK